MRVILILSLLLASCSGGFANRKECKAACTGARKTCNKIDGEYVCILARSEVAGSNGGEDKDDE